MAIDVRSITPAQRARILATTEGHFADLKAHEIAPAKLTNTLSAFANADGGELHIGIAEDKKDGGRNWNGFAIQKPLTGISRPSRLFFLWAVIFRTHSFRAKVTQVWFFKLLF
jgi:hypothetical protein